MSLLDNIPFDIGVNQSFDFSLPLRSHKVLVIEGFDKSSNTLFVTFLAMFLKSSLSYSISLSAFAKCLRAKCPIQSLPSFNNFLASLLIPEILERFLSFLSSLVKSVIFLYFELCLLCLLLCFFRCLCGALRCRRRR